MPAFHPIPPLKKIPLEKLTSTGLGEATGDPSVSGRTSKQLCIWCPLELRTNRAFSLKGLWCCVEMDGGGGQVAGLWVSGFPKNPWLVSGLYSLRFTNPVSK